MEQWSVDRIEGDMVVLETDKKTNICVRLSDFAENIREGDIVYRRSDGRYAVDAGKTAERKKSLFDLQKKIFGD